MGVTRLVPNLDLIQRNVESTLYQRFPMFMGNQQQTAIRNGNDSCGDDAESVVIKFDSHFFALEKSSVCCVVSLP